MINNRIIKKSCLIAMAVLPIVIAILAVVKYGSNTPFWDEWDIVKFYKNTVENGLDFSALIDYQDNEHRIVVPVIVQCAIWAITGGNDIVVLLFSACCLVGALAVIALYWKKKGNAMTLLLPVPVIVFFLKQGQMMLWPSCVMWPLLILFAVLSFYFYQSYEREPNKTKLVLTILFGVLATYSAANGLLIWITYLVLFIAMWLVERKKLFSKVNIAILVSGMVCWTLYFVDWERKLPQYASHSVLEFLEGVVASIGNALFEPEHEWLSIIFGSLFIAVLFVFLLKTCADSEISKYIFPLSIIIFSIGSVCLISYGRSGLEGGVANLLYSQYSLMPLWLWVGAYLLICEVLRKRCTGEILSFYTPCFFYVLLILISIGKFHIFTTCSDFYSACAYTVAHYDEAPMTMRTIRVYPEDVSEEVHWIKENKMFLFANPDNASKLTYPFYDFWIAELDQSFVLPDNEINPGRWYIDTINSEPLPDGAYLEVDEGFTIYGWAVDDLHATSPAAVYIEIDGRYHKAKTVVRPDVATAFGSETYTNSGFQGYVSVNGLSPGEHEATLIILSGDGQSYYKTPFATIITSE